MTVIVACRGMDIAPEEAELALMPADGPGERLKRLGVDVEGWVIVTSWSGAQWSDLAREAAHAEDETLLLALRSLAACCSEVAISSGQSRDDVPQTHTAEEFVREVARQLARGTAEPAATFSLRPPEPPVPIHPEAGSQHPSLNCAQAAGVFCLALNTLPWGAWLIWYVVAYMGLENLHVVVLVPLAVLALDTLALVLALRLMLGSPGRPAHNDVVFTLNVLLQFVTLIPIFPNFLLGWLGLGLWWAGRLTAPRGGRR